MLRKQRKLQPWRRFGYVILIIIKSGELLLWFSPRIINGLRSYIKHSKGCFIRYPNTLKLVKKNSAAPRFLNHFSVFGYRMKHSSSCLIYYFTHRYIYVFVAPSIGKTTFKLSLQTIYFLYNFAVGDLPPFSSSRVNVTKKHKFDVKA